MDVKHRGCVRTQALTIAAVLGLLTKRAIVWRTTVDGTAHGLAVADDRLYVSTDKGTIYCFSEGGPDPPAAPAVSGNTARNAAPAAPLEENHVYAEAAEAIIKATGVTEGYCVDLACGDGRLASALARRTNLRIYAIDADPQNVARARARLDEAGLYVPGLDALHAVDAYNGRRMWTYPLPGLGKAYDQEHLMGAAGTGGVLCASHDSVYVRTGSTCLRIDGVTGKERRVFEIPEQPDGKHGTWGFVALEDDTLFGSVANESHLVPYRYRKSNMRSLFTESRSLFAIDPDTGKWNRPHA